MIRNENEMSLTPLVRGRGTDGPALAIADFFTQRMIDGTTQNVPYMKSRRWRDGDSIMDSTNQYLWRIVA